MYDLHVREHGVISNQRQFFHFLAKVSKFQHVFLTHWKAIGVIICISNRIIEKLNLQGDVKYPKCGSNSSKEFQPKTWKKN